MNKFLVATLAISMWWSCSSNSSSTPEGDVKSMEKDKEDQNSSQVAYSVQYLMGKSDPAQDSAFVNIPKKYADREGLLLRRETFEAYLKMYEAAAQDGIELQIRSATRNFAYQKGIWERKWNGETLLSDGTNVATDISDPKKKALKILLYSSMPGTSRHHWGTDLDLNAFNNAYFEKGEGLKLYNWMLENATSFGFCQPYNAKGNDRPDGYQEEKWHWSYMPLSRSMTEAAEKTMKDEMITGFVGSEQAVVIGVVDKYILGINKACR